MGYNIFYGTKFLSTEPQGLVDYPHMLLSMHIHKCIGAVLVMIAW